MLSGENRYVLEWFSARRNAPVSESNLYPEVDLARVNYLVETGYLHRVQIVPPHCEGRGADGLCGVQITPAGIDLLASENQLRQDSAKKVAKENAKEVREAKWRKQDVRRSWTQFFIGMLVGHVLTRIEFYAGIVASALRWFFDLFH